MILNESGQTSAPSLKKFRLHEWNVEPSEPISEHLKVSGCWMGEEIITRRASNVFILQGVWMDRIYSTYMLNDKVQ